MSRRTRAYWPARVLLGVGIAASLAAFAAAYALLVPPATTGGAEGPPEVLGLPADLVVVAAAVALASIAVAAAIRIYRAWRHGPPPWPYRDR